MTTVLAKSDGQSLLEHTKAALQILRSLKENLPYLAETCGETTLWKDAFLALFFHDFGKAASGFQESLKGGKRWEYRHEVLSAGFVMNLPLSDDERNTIARAILTHHYGIKKLWFDTEYTLDDGRLLRQCAEEMRVNAEYLQMLLKEHLPQLSKDILGESISFPAEVVKIDRWCNPLDLCRGMRRSSPSANRLYCIYLRGFVRTCDHLASAGERTIPSGPLEMASKVKRSVVKMSVDGLHGFQERIMNYSDSLQLAAPTGSGKTEAALLWAAANRPDGRRIFYVLPYTASINAMRQRLKELFKGTPISMLHHKARYFLYKEFLESEDEASAASKTKTARQQGREIYAPIKVITPFQIIRAFYGVKGFEISLVEMSGALFVFDEIHCYDPRTLGLIAASIAELNRYGAQFLFMSATFPKFLTDILSQSLGKPIELLALNPNDPKEKKLLNQSRHTINILDGDIIQHLPRIKEAIESEHRTLVVCNTVARAQKVYDQLKDVARKPVLIHSRFIVRDREVLEAKLKGKDCDLLVGTQVIEVSLDISFDCLFSEPAPLDAFLQRMGRVNRKGELDQPASVFIFTDGSKQDHYIYPQEKVDGALQALSPLGGGSPLSNAKAATLIQDVYRDGLSAEDVYHFNDVKNQFSDLIKKLPLFDEYPIKESLFNELFDSVKVVPLRFSDELDLLIEAKRFLEIEGLTLSVSQRRFKYLRNQGRTTYDEKTHTYFADARYLAPDEEGLGLTFNEKEPGVGIMD